MRALQQLAEDPLVPARVALRARIVLMAASGATNREIAARLGTSPPTVALWRRRYEIAGAEGLQDQPRPGRPRSTATARSHVHIDGGVDQLLAAAARTISRRGFAATRVADIAAEAGVSPGTVHYHFKTRHQILVSALLHSNEQMICEQENSESGERDPALRLAQLLERTIPYPGVHRDEYLLEIDLWSQVRLHPDLLPAWERYEERWLAHVTQVIDAGLSSGAFTSTVDAAEVAERLVAMTDGLAAQTAIGAARMPPERVRDLVLRFAAEQLGVEPAQLDTRAARARSTAR